MTARHPKAGLSAAALATVLAFGATASAAPISKCDAAKKKCIGKYIAAQLSCHAKAESKGVAVDTACLDKGVLKITGGGKGCFDKNEAKVANDCSNLGGPGDELAAADALILDVITSVDPGYPTPVLSKCGAARKKCAGKEAAGLMGCSAKESKDGSGDPSCAPKILDKFDDGAGGGCDGKALLGTDCLGTSTSAVLGAKADAWSTGTDSRIEAPPAVGCGNGALDGGEDCDPVGAANSCQNASNTGPGFSCNKATCQCACPTKLTFGGDSSDPLSVLDLGWTGLAHREPIISNGEWTVALSGCAGSSRPCGVCTVSGPIANPNAGAGQIANRRCTNDTSIKCTSDAPCTGGGGTCQYFAGSNLGLGVGGVTICVVDQFNGPITGTANVESGELVTNTSVIRRLYNALTVDSPCPRCFGDPTINDGSAGGTCNGGPRNGLACDSNGAVPDRPDFGETSLDCPPDPLAIFSTVPDPSPIAITSATDPVTKTVTASSPTCGDLSGENCLCDTCNNINREPCTANADCPDPAGPIGPICGGTRCLGGANDGAACTSNTVCPGGLCNRAGWPSSPSSCLDNTATANILDCTDVDGEGECTEGPVGKSCSVASGHAQRGCLTDVDCGCAPSSGCCEAHNRPCFPTGTRTGTGKVGTQTLIANGMEDTPMGDTSSPTLGAVYCARPFVAQAVNTVIGLPGPARVTIKGTAVSRP